MTSVEEGVGEAQAAIDDVLSASLTSLEGLLVHDKSLKTSNILDMSKDLEETVASLLQCRMKLSQSKKAYDEALSQVNSLLLL